MEKRTATETRRPQLALAGAFLLFGAAALAGAQPRAERHGGGGPGGHGHGGPGRLAEELGLSDEQQAQWREIHEQHRDENRGLGEELRERRRAFEEALEGGRDASAVGALAIEVHKLQQQLAASMKELEQQLAAVLTDEQRAEWEQWKADHPRRGRGGRPPFGPPPGDDD